MEILKTKPGDANFHLFTDLPKHLYPSGSIRHKESENINPEFLDTCYVFTIDKQPVARLALYNNPYLSYNQKKTACLGNYECVKNTALSNDVIAFAIDEAKKKDADFLIGPMNGSTWDNYRFSTHHDTANFLLEPYHHLYYNDHFLNIGFKPIANYTSSMVCNIVCDQEDIVNREHEFIKLGVTIRPINMNDYETELKKLYPFISAAFKNNFLYTPITWETFRNKYIDAAKIINPEYVLIAEDATKNTIGFIFSYDDLYNLEEKCLVVKTVARDISRQWSGLGHVITNRVVRLIKSKGYASIIPAFMIKEATSSGLSTDFSGTTYKDYSLYGKEI